MKYALLNHNRKLVYNLSKATEIEFDSSPEGLELVRILFCMTPGKLITDVRIELMGCKYLLEINNKHSGIYELGLQAHNINFQPKNDILEMECWFQIFKHSTMPMLKAKLYYGDLK